MRKLIPVLLALVGLGAGVGAGLAPFAQAPRESRAAVRAAAERELSKAGPPGSER